MKKTLLSGLLSMSCLVLLTACSDESPFGFEESGRGRIVPTVDLNPEAISSRTDRGAIEGYSVGDLSLKITSADGKHEYNWASVNQFDPDKQTFPVGDYTMEAAFGSVDVEGFDQPAFYGSTSFTVKENTTTSVALNATLVNSMVSVVYTEAFKNFMLDYSAELHADEGQYLYYAKDEVRPVYMRPGNTLLKVSVTKPNGTEATIEAAHFTTKPRYHYVITVDVNNSQVGSAETLVINFDEMLDEEEVEIDLSDELINAAAPVVEAQGFESGASIDFVPGMLPDGNFKINIVARGKLGSVKLNTLSASLRQQGWPAEVDLIGASESVKATLQSLGFSCIGLWHNPDQMAVIDLTKVLPNITTVDGDNANVFTLTVTDRYGKQAEPVTLAFNAENLGVSIAAISQLNVGDDTMTVDVLYNGRDVEKNVKIQTPNERGTWSNVTVVGVENVSSRAMSTYRFTIRVPQSTNPFDLRAVAGEAYISESTTVVPFRLTYGIEMDQRNVYAYTATITATSTEAPAETVAADYELRLSTDGGNTYSRVEKTVDGAKMMLSGLQPATTYRARLFDADGKASNALTFTTEPADQLPNSSMEDWFTIDGKTSNWWVEYPGQDANAAWGTMNLLTTSEGGTGTSSSDASGCSYAAFSGTRATDDGYNGRGAIIESVGWGSKNLPPRRIILSTRAAECHNFTAGELYLGHYDATAKAPAYGTAFTGRPKAMSFYYKYTAKNSADFGVASFTLYDADGNVLAEASQDLTATAEYTLVTFNLDYASKEKAARLSVVFKSSGNSDCLPQSYNASYMSQPSTGNYGTDRFTGSSLYIDEIELTY